MNRTPLPSTGSSWGEFPGFFGTTSVSDFSPSLPRRFVSFAARYLAAHRASCSSRLPRRRCATGAGLGLGVRIARVRFQRGDDEISQVPGAPPRACPALRPRWSLGAPDPRALRRGLPLPVRRRPPRSLTFGAPSHGPRARCLRFAAALADGPTQDSLPAGDQPLPGGIHFSARRPSVVSATLIRSSHPPPPGFLAHTRFESICEGGRTSAPHLAVLRRLPTLALPKAACGARVGACEGLRPSRSCGWQGGPLRYFGWVCTGESHWAGL